MKIAQIIAPGKLAGAERHVLELSSGLQERGCEVVLMCHSPQTFMFEAAKQKGVRTISLYIGKGKPWKNPLALLEWVKILRRERVDLVATHLSRATLWGGWAGKIARLPVVSTVQAPRDASRSYRRAAMQIAVSDAVREAVLARGFSEKKVKIVYNGIDTCRFSLSGNGMDAKNALGLAPDALVLGIGAHLSRHKGHAWAMEALAPLFETHPQLHWLFVGDGPERGALEALSARLGIAPRVHFAGFQRDVVPFFAAIDVAVLPSLEAEGLPLFLAEIGAMQKPIVTCDSGGSSEVVVPGETGFIVPPRDAAALRAAVEPLVEDAALRARLGEAGRQRVIELFSHDKMIDETLLIYRGLLAHR